MNSWKKILFAGIVVIGGETVWARVEAVIGGVDLQSNPNLAISMPQTENPEILISRDQYLISYNKQRRAPNWVAWKLESSQLGHAGRTNKFRPDSDLQKYLEQSGGNYQAVQSTDYTNSCFDRGHQIPSGDRTDNEDNNAMTFFMSNMIPQTPYLNRVIWEHLENYTRSLVEKEGKKVYVIAGPIYDEDFGSIGPKHDIPVPSKDFKVVFILNSDQSAADINSSTPKIVVIMPNVLKNGDHPVASTPNCGGQDAASESSETETADDWKRYQTTLDDVQSESGLTFSALPAVAH